MRLRYLKNNNGTTFNSVAARIENYMPDLETIFFAKSNVDLVILCCFLLFYLKDCDMRIRTELGVAIESFCC